MNTQREIFYNLFWNNTACRRLFLLSKEELLDTYSFNIENEEAVFCFPRIILSNLSDDAPGKEQSKFRVQRHALIAEKTMQQYIDQYTPQIEAFFKSKFGKSVDRLIQDFEKHPFKLLGFVFSLAIGNEKQTEKKIIHLLQEYGFIGKHINSFAELEAYVQREAIQKNLRSVLTQNNFMNVVEMLRCAKDLYWTETVKTMADSNQVLVNALYDKENFENRLLLFDLLYDQRIIFSGNNESFLECHQCDQGQYRGMMQMRMRPTRTERLVCPICGSRLRFYIPYELDREIYELIRSKDGLLLDAIAGLAEKNGCDFKLNMLQSEFPSMEIDCVIKTARKRIIIEAKMYRHDIGERKIKLKMKGHAGEIFRDAEQIRERMQDKFEIVPLLVTNISNSEILNQVRSELTDPVQIMSIEELAEALPTLIQ